MRQKKRVRTGSNLIFYVREHGCDTILFGRGSYHSPVVFDGENFLGVIFFEWEGL